MSSVKKASSLKKSEPKAVLSSPAEQRSLVELARDKGYDVLSFLERVMRGEWEALGEPKPIPLSLRIAAADLLRKYAALPANVNLEIDTRKMFIYRGGEDLKPLPAGQLPPDVLKDG